MNNYPVPQESVESGLLYSIDGNMERWVAINNELASEDFTSCRDIIVFMKQYLEQYRTLPSNGLISSRFQWQPTLGDFAYWMVEMQRYTLARRVLAAIQSGYNQISTPDTALSTLIQELSQIRSRQSNHVQAVDAAALDRLALFDVRTEYLFVQNRMLGMTTSINILNDSMVGWMKGDMIGVFARPGVGKTWWMLQQAAIAWKNGYRVLIISTEMPTNRLSLRSDTIVGAELGLEMDFYKINRGDPSIRPQYEALLNYMSQSQRWWMYDSYEERPVSLANLDNLIRQHQPDLVCVDGISLLQATTRGQQWEQMKELSYGVKNLATIHEIAAICTHQASNTERGRHRDESLVSARSDTFYMPSMNDIAYGDAFGQACSDLIAMCPEPTNDHINWFAIKKNRDRGWSTPLAPRMGIAIDFGTGRLIDLSRLGYDPRAVGEETNRLFGIRAPQLGEPRP